MIKIYMKTIFEEKSVSQKKINLKFLDIIIHKEV